MTNNSIENRNLRDWIQDLKCEYYLKTNENNNRIQYQKKLLSLEKALYNLNKNYDTYKKH